MAGIRLQNPATGRKGLRLDHDGCDVKEDKIGFCPLCLCLAVGRNSRGTHDIRKWLERRGQLDVYRDGSFEWGSPELEDHPRHLDRCESYWEGKILYPLMAEGFMGDVFWSKPGVCVWVKELRKNVWCVLGKHMSEAHGEFEATHGDLGSSGS